MEKQIIVWVKASFSVSLCSPLRRKIEIALGNLVHIISVPMIPVNINPSLNHSIFNNQCIEDSFAFKKCHYIQNTGGKTVKNIKTIVKYWIARVGSGEINHTSTGNIVIHSFRCAKCSKFNLDSGLVNWRTILNSFSS